MGGSWLEEGGLGASKGGLSVGNGFWEMVFERKRRRAVGIRKRMRVEAHVKARVYSAGAFIHGKLHGITHALLHAFSHRVYALLHAKQRLVLLSLNSDPVCVLVFWNIGCHQPLQAVLVRMRQCVIVIAMCGWHKGSSVCVIGVKDALYERVE